MVLDNKYKQCGLFTKKMKYSQLLSDQIIITDVQQLLDIFVKDYDRKDQLKAARVLIVKINRRIRIKDINKRLHLYFIFIPNQCSGEVSFV